MNPTDLNKSLAKIGFHSSWVLALLTLFAFGLGMIAIPPSGPNCMANCMTYPYPEILAYFPRDYFWMVAAIFQICAFVIFMVANHFNTTVDKKIYSFIGVSFALIASTALLVDYFVQVSVVPVSVMQGQMEGIPLLTQYNGHGIFIALEELGFTMMGVAFFFLALAFPTKSRLEKTIRWVLISPLLVSLFSFVVYSIQYGLNRDYRYEVASLSINWTVCILAGILMSIYYKRNLTGNLTNG